MSPTKQRLDRETLAKLRLAVGVPPEGPSETLKKAWATEDRILGDDHTEAPTAVTDVDKLNAELVELRTQLRAEHGRRGNLASQLTKLRQEKQRLCAEYDQLLIDASETPQLRAEVDQLREQVDVQQRRAERAEHQRNTWKGEYDRVVDDKLVELTEALEERDAARAERDQLTALLEEATPRITEMQQQVEDVIATAEQLTATAAEALAPAPHRHAWEWQPGLKAMPIPCACGRPWPRNRPVDMERVRPRVEVLKSPNTFVEQTGDNDHEGQ